MEAVIERINWSICIVSALVYLLVMVVLGDLLINSVGEQVGPVTDMVLTALILLVIVFVAARRSYDHFLSAVAVAGCCFVAQLLLSGLTVGFGLLPLLFQLILFTIVGLAGGFAAARL